jgi:cobalt-zinc-cadmium efflux system outer membrane protein
MSRGTLAVLASVAAVLAALVASVPARAGEPAIADRRATIAGADRATTVAPPAAVAVVPAISDATVATVASVASVAGVDGAPLGATLAGLLDYARQASPELAARRLAAEGARERAAAASALPDPRFQLELMDFTNTMSGDGASLLPGQVGETRYRVIQPLPFWGKRELRGAVAEAEAEVAGALREQTRLDLERRIKAAFAGRYRALGQQRILDDTLALAERFERLALTRYSVGLVPQQDVLRAQSERTRLAIERLGAGERAAVAAAQLAALLALPGPAGLAEPLALPARRQPPELSTLVERALEGSPEVASARQSLAASERMRALASRERYPDLAVGLTNNRPRDGRDSWDLMIEVDIPLQQGRRRSQEREAERAREAALAGLRAVEATTAGRLGEARAAYAAELQRERLLASTLLPQAEANLRAAIADYESGRIDFATLIEAERQVLEARMRLLDAEVEAALRLAELETIVGGEL